MTDEEMLEFLYQQGITQEKVLYYAKNGKLTYNNFLLLYNTGSITDISVNIWELLINRKKFIANIMELDKMSHFINIIKNDILYSKNPYKKIRIALWLRSLYENSDELDERMEKESIDNIEKIMYFDNSVSSLINLDILGKHEFNHLLHSIYLPQIIFKKIESNFSISNEKLDLFIDFLNETGLLSSPTYFDYIIPILKSENFDLNHLKKMIYFGYILSPLYFSILLLNKNFTEEILYDIVTEETNISSKNKLMYDFESVIHLREYNNLPIFSEKFFRFLVDKYKLSLPKEIYMSSKYFLSIQFCVDYDINLTLTPKEYLKLIG